MTRGVSRVSGKGARAIEQTLGWEAPTEASNRVELPPSGAPRPDVLQTGEVVGGQYEVVAKIGEGGMAQVYEAVDLILGRRVAI